MTIRALIASRRRQLACARLEKMGDRESFAIQDYRRRRQAMLKHTRGDG